jgi:pre-mRNA-splicing factor 38A
MQGFSDVLRKRIQRNQFWVDKCADASFLDVVSLAADLEYIEGFIGEAGRPTPFVCLLLRLMQLQPTGELLDEMIRQDKLKYLKFIAITLVRLVEEDPTIVHAALDVGLAQYTSLRVRTESGEVSVMPFDLVCEKLTSSSLFGIPLPSLLSRANAAQLHPELRHWPRQYDTTLRS